MNITYREDEFLQCAKQGKTDAVKLFLDAGMNPNVKTRYDFTALMEASNDGYTEIVQALLAKDVDINVKTKDGKTALMLAVENKQPDIVKLLKDAGAKE